MRLTYDAEVEADSYDEAVEKVRDKWEETKYEDMDYGSQDVDAWEE